MSDRGVEVAAPAVVDDEGRQAADDDPADGLHPQAGEVDRLAAHDVLVGDQGRRPADRPQEDPAARLQRLDGLGGPVALAEGHERGPGLHEVVEVAVHALGRGRPEAARGQAARRLGRPGVVHRVALEVVGDVARLAQDRGQAGVGDVAGHDERPGEADERPGRERPQRVQDLGHRPVEVDVDRPGGPEGPDALEEAGRTALDLLEEDAVGRDLAPQSPVGVAGDGQADRARSGVPRQADEAGLVGQPLAAELGPETGLSRQAHDPRLPPEVAEGGPAPPAPLRQAVEEPGRGQLGRLEGHVRGQAADDDGDPVGRAGGDAEGPDLLGQEGLEALFVEQGLRFLEQGDLVGRAAALGQEEEAVLPPRGEPDVDLGGQVRPGVALLEDRDRGHDRIAQVALPVDLRGGGGQDLSVPSAGRDEVAALGEDLDRARVLAERQDALGRDDGVAQDGPGDETVVGRGLGVVEDAPYRRQEVRPEMEGEIGEGLAGQGGQRGVADAQGRPPAACRPPRPAAGPADRQPAVTGPALPCPSDAHS